VTARCGPPIDCSETYGRLVIDGETLHRGGWCAFDLSSLYDSPEFAGENFRPEGIVGSVAYPTITAETDYSLPMMFSGAVDPDDAPYAPGTDARGALLANRFAFEQTFVTPIRTGTATLPATLTVPFPSPTGVRVFSFDVQPLRLTGWTLLPLGYARTVLDLRVPVPTFLDGEGEGE
jgi:hypothetical protein